MEQSDQSISPEESDIAYLKRLALAGRGEPAPFLLLMAVFGAAYGAAFLLIATVLHVRGPDVFGTTDPQPVIQVIAASPFVAHIFFVVALIWTGWRTFGPRKAKLSRSAVAIWSAAFIALVTVVFAFNVYTAGEPSTDHIYTAYMLPPMLLVLWGCAWWATAILSDRRWLLVFSIASFGGAIAVAVIGNRPPLLFASAACLLGLAFLPAVLLMRKQR